MEKDYVIPEEDIDFIRSPKPSLFGKQEKQAENQIKTLVDLEIYSADSNQLSNQKAGSNVMKCFSLLNTAPNSTTATNISQNKNIIDFQNINIEKDIEKKLGDYFCEAFFISGIPYKKANLSNNTDTYLPLCSHKECSILPSYKPEILYKYPPKDTKCYELNNSVYLYS